MCLFLSFLKVKLCSIYSFVSFVDFVVCIYKSFISIDLWYSMNTSQLIYLVYYKLTFEYFSVHSTTNDATMNTLCTGDKGTSLVELPGLTYILIVCNTDTFKQSIFKIGLGRKSQKNRVKIHPQLDQMQTLFIKLIINSFTVSASYHHTTFHLGTKAFSLKTLY